MLEADPLDPLAPLYLERSKAGRAQPPKDDWGGTFFDAKLRHTAAPARAQPIKET